MNPKKAGTSNDNSVLSTDTTLHCYAILMDISLGDLKQAIEDTGLSAEEIVKKYFDQQL
jgi:hypothetical protein